MKRPRDIPPARDRRATVDVGTRPSSDDDFDQQLASCYRDAASQLSARTQVGLLTAEILTLAAFVVVALVKV